MKLGIFKHSLRLLQGNSQQAIKLSSPLIAILVLGLVLVGPDFFVRQASPDAMPQISATGGFLQLMLAIFSLWVAVAWHRYILLEEIPDGTLPAFHGGRMLAYFWRAFLISLLVGVAVLALMLGVGLVLFWIPPVMMLAMLVVSIAASWAFYRLSPILPAAAIDKKLTMSEAWAQSKPLSGTILTTMIVFMVSIAICGVIGNLIASVIPILGGVFMLVVNWLYIMLGISILTTIYGITIEGRSIPD